MNGRRLPASLLAYSLARHAGALADHYRIDRELGAGGMATVYLAEDPKYRREAAIKVSQEGELPIHEAVRLTIEIVDALAHAHEHGSIPTALELTTRWEPPMSS